MEELKLKLIELQNLRDKQFEIEGEIKEMCEARLAELTDLKIGDKVILTDEYDIEHSGFIDLIKVNVPSDSWSIKAALQDDFKWITKCYNTVSIKLNKIKKDGSRSLHRAYNDNLFDLTNFKATKI